MEEEEKGMIAEDQNLLRDSQAMSPAAAQDLVEQMLRLAHQQRPAQQAEMELASSWEEGKQNERESPR